MLKLNTRNIKIVEVPKNDDIKCITPFSDYFKKGGRIYGDVNPNLSYCAINYPNVEDDGLKSTPAYQALDLLGKGAYDPNYQILFITKGMKDYERTLTHELGHHKQNVKSGYNLNNTTRILLEYHNVLFNENLFDDNFRVFYDKDKTSSNKNQWNKAKDSNARLNIVNELEQQAANGLKELHKVVVKSNKEKDLDVYKEIMVELEKLEMKVDDNNLETRFTLARYIYNLFKEVEPELQKSADSS